MSYAERVVRHEKQRRKAELAARKKQFPGYVDTIIVSYNGHGRKKRGFRAEFGEYRTHTSGATLVGFAQAWFGTGGTLKFAGREATGERWHVIKGEQ